LSILTIDKIGRIIGVFCFLLNPEKFVWLKELLQKDLVLLKITSGRGFMGFGLLYVDNAHLSHERFWWHEERYLPIFFEDKELVSSVLSDAIKKWEMQERYWKSHVNDFVLIAQKMSWERGGGFSIGPEAVSQQCL
jgi:hypothetical protein